MITDGIGNKTLGLRKAAKGLFGRYDRKVTPKTQNSPEVERGGGAGGAIATGTKAGTARD